MDTQKASYSMTLMAKILGVTRAGYYAWKNRVGQRTQRAAARQRLDDAAAWEHEVSGNTYETPCIQCTLTHSGVDVGVRAVAASMRRLGLTSLHARPRPAKRSGRPLWPMRTTAPASGTNARLTACGSRISPTCGARKAGSTCAPCAMRTRAGSWDTPWASSKTRGLVITALDMAAITRGSFPAGVVLHADQGTQFTSQKLAAYMRAAQGTVSMGQNGVCWDNAVAESFWTTHTTAYYYRHTFATRDQVYTGVATWIKDFYNRRRIHTSLGGKSPIEHERYQAARTTAT